MQATPTRAVLRASAVACLLLPLAAGCSGSSGSSGPSGGGTSADFLIGDAPQDDLLSFTAQLDSLRLERQDGRLTDDLLADPVRLEFLGLEDRLAWIGSARPATGNYVAVHVGFVPFSYTAVAEDGSAVTVNAVSDELVARFPAPRAFDRREYSRFEIDLNLLDSLQGDVSAGTITFDPRGSAEATDGSAPVVFDELQGVVRTADAGTGTLVLDAFLDDARTLPLGRVRLQVDPLTLLLSESNTIYLSPVHFLDDLVAGKSVVEVHGDLTAGGAIDPRWIRVQDLTGAVPAGNAVELEGRIVGLSAGGFDLRVREVVEGTAVADPVLVGLGRSTVQVATGPLGRTLLDSGDLVPGSQLAVGQTVRVAFTDFATEPFPAGLVVLRHLDPRFDGEIVDDAGLPANVVLHLDPNEPALIAGLVASTATDVVLDVTATPVTLDLRHRPVLQADQLLSDLRLKVRGTLSGTPAAPALQASDVVVVPGRLADAQVVSADEGTSSFATTGGTLLAPFGGMVFPGPTSVTIQPGAVFLGDASSEAEFFALFAGLGAGEVLAVEVHGIGTGVPNEIGAYQLRASVQ